MRLYQEETDHQVGNARVFAPRNLTATITGRRKGNGGGTSEFGKRHAHVTRRLRRDALRSCRNTRFEL